jgi:hypothetical protein
MVASSLEAPERRRIAIALLFERGAPIGQFTIREANHGPDAEVPSLALKRPRA